MSLSPATATGAALSSGLLLFAAASPGTVSAEELTISIFKVAGIVGAVAVGSWTTSRKLKGIEDAITAGKKDRALMRNQIARIQNTLTDLACLRAPGCNRRRKPKPKHRK